MKHNTIMTTLGVCLAIGLMSPSVLGEEHNEGFEQRLHAMELEARELELQNQRMDLESRELDLQHQRMEIAALERRIDGAFDGAFDDDDREGRRGPGAHGKRGGHCGGCAVICVILFVAHILLAIWVQGDAKRRGVSYGLWLTLTLLTGFLGAITYALVRIGDVQEAKASGKK
jgi:hypothetical protein